MNGENNNTKTNIPLKNAFKVLSPYKKFTVKIIDLALIAWLHNNASMYSLNVEPLVLFQAMSDKTRLRLLKLLVSLPTVEACLCELGDSLKEPEYNVSRHLKILRQAGFLSFRKEGRWVYHRFNTNKAIKPFRRLIADLPDSDGSFVEDRKRFKAELLKRRSGRCAKEGSSFDQPLIRTSRAVSS